MTPPLRLNALRELDVMPSTRRTSLVQPLELDTYNSHPATGLTAEMLLAYYRQAEYGLPVRQFDCFDDMREIDAGLRSLIEQRIQAVAGCDMIIRPGRDDAQSVKAAEIMFDGFTRDVGVSNIAGAANDNSLEGLIEHHLMAPHDGIAISNLVWDWLDRVVFPVEMVHAAPRRFKSPDSQRAWEIELITDVAGQNTIPLAWGLWCVSRYKHRNPWAAGLMRTASWWSMFKRWSIRDWQVFAELFGLPMTIGYYEEGASRETRQKLKEALQQLGTDGFALLAKNVEIIVKENARAGDSSTVYPQIARLCEEQMQKLILGGTLTTDAGGPNSKGSYALGTVHESRAYALARADARRVQAMFRRDIGIPFVRWNGFDRAAPPELKIQISRDSLERAKVLEIVGQVVELDPEQIYEDFTLRKPRGTGVKFSPKAGPPEEEDRDAA